MQILALSQRAPGVTAADLARHQADEARAACASQCGSCASRDIECAVHVAVVDHLRARLPNRAPVLRVEDVLLALRRVGRRLAAAQRRRAWQTAASARRTQRRPAARDSPVVTAFA